MRLHLIHRRALAFVVGLAIIAFSPWAAADPPSRVARLGYMAGAVSFSPAGENDWVRATLNRPLGPGDRLWTDADGRGRAEIQVGGAMIRMAGGTSLAVLNLDDRITQLQVTQGSLNVRVRRLDAGQVVEVDTPNLAFTLRQPGAYRIEVDPEGNATTIIVRQGSGEAYGEDAAYLIAAPQAYRFAGTGLRDYQRLDAPRLDDFDRWAGSRDRGYDSSRSARYVSADVVGYQDLDAYGTWRVDDSYGNVWVPNRVDANWSPYSDGHWAWIDPWGWTWIDNAPWGFAVSHYGRWASLSGYWVWVPGPVRTRAYYAPALVAFVGGSNFQLSLSSGSIGAVAWFPLAPREVYRPSYPVSRRYFENVNRSNTVINNTVINTQYNTINTTNVTNVVYANRQITGAVVAVPTTAFVQSQPVSSGRQRVSREALAGRPVMVVPSVAPTEKSVRGAATNADQPPPKVFERPVVARSAVPAAHAGFAAQREQLATKPGRPLDTASRQGLKAEATAPAPVVKVLPPRSEAVKAAPPPAAARPEERRGQPDSRRDSSAPVPPSAPPDKSAPTARPPGPLAPEAEPRGRRESDERRGPPDSRRDSAVPVPPSAPPPDKSAPTAKPQPPLTPVPEPRGKRDTDERRGPPDSRRDNAAPVPPSAPPPDKSAPTTRPPGQLAPEAEPRGRRETDERRGPPDSRRDSAVPLPPSAPPPDKAVAPAPTSREQRETDARREPRSPATTPPERPSAPMPAARPERNPEAAGQPPESRGRGEPRNMNEPPPPPVAQPKAAAPPESAPRPAKAPEAPAREPRGSLEQRGSPEPRPPVVTPPPRPPEPKAPPPQAAPPQRAAPPPPPPTPPAQAAPPQPAPKAAPPAPAPQAAPPPTEKPKEQPRGRGEKEREDDKAKHDK